MKVEKYELFFRTMDRWMELREKGYLLSEALENRDITKIAIYGVASMGRHLYTELIGTNIDIVYFIDRRGLENFEGIKAYKPDESFPSVDAIIVTAIYDFDEIEDYLNTKTDIPVISLEELIYERE